MTVQVQLGKVYLGISGLHNESLVIQERHSIENVCYVYILTTHCAKAITSNLIM